MASGGESAGAAVERAFGADNRARLLTEFLDAAGAVTPENAWQLVYRLLLWIDRTTGLAHCYESDKCQPGRPWYARSLAFHDWLSREFGVEPAELGAAIDHLFRAAVTGLARKTEQQRAAAATDQRQPYEGRGFPLPGEDAELTAVVRDVLGAHLVSEPSDEEWRRLAENVQAYLGQENKRKNLLGEGFEDTLTALIRRLPGAAGYEVRNRVLLGEIIGFNPQGEVEKRKRVDLAIWRSDGTHRTLVTSKWSVRADREEQFKTDFEAYVRVNTGQPFDHILVTNEFDAARLKAACQELSANAHLFAAVVHVNPEGVLQAYGKQRRGAAKELAGFVESRRLISLEQWLSSLVE
ncbi:MAG: hypothetical protein ACR2IR_09460 [Acidimicrobiia bacterium]